MPRGVAPETAGDLDDWWKERFASDRIFLTGHARAVGGSIGMKMPVPLYARAPMRAAALVLVGSPPARA